MIRVTTDTVIRPRYHMGTKKKKNNPKRKQKRYS